METEQAIEIFRDHLNMKDGTEFIWKDWEDAALHILTLAQEAEQNKGEISDGYHTFNELYEHRHSLFCALTKAYPENSWKSKFHSDGTMFDGWFIAGIDTNKGNATYHLPISWWNDFEIDELPNALEWDGHTSNDVISRIKTLSPRKIIVRDGHGDLIDPQEFFPCQECKTKDEYLDIIRQEAEQLRKERDELFTWKNNARHAKAELDLERIRLQDIIRDMEAKLDKAKARATELEAILEARGE